MFVLISYTCDVDSSMDVPVGKICILCFREIAKTNERYIVEGRGKFNVCEELNTLPFQCKRTSDFICVSCVKNLKKRRSLVDQQQKLENTLEEIYKKGETIQQSVLKRSSAEDCALVSTPKKVRCSPTVEISTPLRTLTKVPFCPVSPILSNRKPQDELHQERENPGKAETSKTNTDVTVKVKWPSKNVERKLPEDLESLGKMLVRGTYKQIANAAWKSDFVKKELIKLVLKDIEKETTELCSKKNPSCLRKTDKDSMLLFNVEKLSSEVKERAPLFHSILSVACINSKSRASQPSNIDFGAIAMASAVCLRNRSRYMIVMQLLITTILYHSYWMVSTYLFLL